MKDKWGCAEELYPSSHVAAQWGMFWNLSERVASAKLRGGRAVEGSSSLSKDAIRF